MVLHIRALHESEVKYSCSECHRLFRTTAERRHHVVRAHESEYGFLFGTLSISSSCLSLIFSLFYYMLCSYLLQIV